MTLHLKKLSVGSESVETLAAWQAHRKKETGKTMHVTRNFPRRRDELLAGGSIYWIIKGKFAARQEIKDFIEVIQPSGKAHCGIVLKPKLIKLIPRQHRGFQGWRYLSESDAPADLANIGDTSEIPPELLAELKDLGLL